MARARKQESQLVPGTTSKILWHFTGGRKPDPLTGKRTIRKSPREAFSNLKNILKTGQLKISEDVIPLGGREWKQRFCSVAEIPIQHLQYHSARYGKFALGFYRDRLRGPHRFRPVHYVIESKDDVEDFLHPSWSALYWFFHLPDFQNDILKMAQKFSLDFSRDFRSRGPILALHTILGFIKLFSLDEFQTVYCEREWRNVHGPWQWPEGESPERDLFYTLEDVNDGKKSDNLCLIVVPKEPRDYVAQLSEVISSSDTLRLKYGHVPIIAFEDLLEH